MRVPSYMKESIETLIRVQAEWLSEDEERKPVVYLDEAEEKRRIVGVRMIWWKIRTGPLKICSEQVIRHVSSMRCAV